MRVLVTGGTGFVGGWTAKAIAEEVIPALRPGFARADEVSAHVFAYDPI